HIKTHAHTQTLKHTHTHTHTKNIKTHAHTQTLKHTLCLSLFLSRTHTHTHTHTRKICAGLGNCMFECLGKNIHFFSINIQNQVGGNLHIVLHRVTQGCS